MRLDLILVEKGFAKSRAKAKELINNGNVLVNSKTITKSSFDYVDGEIKIVGETLKYVSRGGLKLEGAIKTFNIDVKDMVAIDIGASTGGFTDCLLQNGASHVYSIDSGYNQLDSSLVENPNVTNIEHYNARNLSLDVIGEKVDIAVADLSFISSTYIIPRLKEVIKENGLYIGLIKPQFECGKEAIGKNGIVKDKKQHFLAIKKVIESLIATGLSVNNLAKSPILGGDGNKEFLVYAIFDGNETKIDDLFIRKVVEE